MGIVAIGAFTVPKHMLGKGLACGLEALILTIRPVRGPVFGPLTGT